MLQMGAHEYEEHAWPTPLLMLSVNRENIKNINLNKIYQQSFFRHNIFAVSGKVQCHYIIAGKKGGTYSFIDLGVVNFCNYSNFLR